MGYCIGQNWFADLRSTLKFGTIGVLVLLGEAYYLVLSSLFTNITIRSIELKKPTKTDEKINDRHQSVL
jgi:hypothetical protein